MRSFRIRNGLDVAIEGAPHPALTDAPAPASVGVLGADYPSLQPRLRVAEGDAVPLGEVLFEDRKTPDLVVTSPAAGVVTRIERGDRRSLLAIEVRCEGSESVPFPRYPPASLDGLTRKEVVVSLLRSGLWAALRERPFGRIPQPDAYADALFITAMDSRPLGCAVDLVLNEARDDFRAGLQVLQYLPSGPAYLCMAAESQASVPEVPGVERVVFGGPHPAGLPGTHIHLLAPVGGERRVWYVGYQDVIAVGRLFLTGRVDPERIVALGGPGLRHPRHIRTRLGVALPDLLDGELHSGAQRVISGSPLCGRQVEERAAFLGRYHDQVSVLPEAGARQRGTTTAQHGRPTNFVALRRYERLSPLDLMVVPLLRALLAGDLETARALGCLELEEEDLSLLTYACPSKQDYGPPLRSLLNRIEGGG